MSEAKPNHNDEIDLRDIFSYIGNIIKSIGNSILGTILGIRAVTLRYFKLVFTLGLLGGIGGIALFFVETPVYYSEMILRSSVFGGDLLENSVEELSELAGNANYKELSKQLGISEAEAEMISEFTYTPFVNEDELIEMEILKATLKDDLEDPGSARKVIEAFQTNNRTVYRIGVSVYNNEVLAVLDSGFYNYLAKKPYVQKREEIDESNLRREKANLLKNVEAMDSLKEIFTDSYVKMVESLGKGSNNVILAESGVKSPLPVYDKILELNHQIRQIDRELYLKTRLEILDGFTPFDKPANLGPIKKGIIGGLVGLVLAYLIIMFVETNRYLARKAAERESAA